LEDFEKSLASDTQGEIRRTRGGTISLKDFADQRRAYR